MRRQQEPTVCPETVAALVNAMRAEIQAYRAEVAAWHAVTDAVIQRIDNSTAIMEADIAAVLRRVYDATADDASERWRELARDILADDAKAMRARLSALPDFPDSYGETETSAFAPPVL